jgi:hypothetical protein
MTRTLLSSVVENEMRTPPFPPAETNVTRPTIAKYGVQHTVYGRVTVLPGELDAAICKALLCTAKAIYEDSQ